MVVSKMQMDLKERTSALALNYGILLSSPLKNCKKDKAEDERAIRCRLCRSVMQLKSIR